jgi:hypothetical protein
LEGTQIDVDGEGGFEKGRKMFQFWKSTRMEKNESTTVDSKLSEPTKKSFFKDKTFLVTGGTGFLGSHLIPLVRKQRKKKMDFTYKIMF